MKSLLVCQNCNWSIVFWKMKQRVKRKKKNGDNAFIWKLLPSILIDWKRPSVAQADIFAFSERRMAVTLWATEFKLLTMTDILPILICMRPPFSDFYALFVRRRSEIPKIWEDNKTMQMCFTFITWNMVMFPFHL